MALKIFENEIAKYERRIRSIERKASPTMLKANKILYQAELENNKDLLRWWQEGKPFIVASTVNSIMYCFGDYQVLPLVRIADRLSAGDAQSVIDKVRAMGLPDWACDRTILFLPLALAGEDLPMPKIVVASTGFCEVITDTHKALARMLDVPLYTTDVSFEEPSLEKLSYVVGQFEKLIEWVEATLPGAKFSYEKLAEWQDIERRWFALLHDIYELRKRVPCPDHPRDVFREATRPQALSNPYPVLDYYEAYREELRQRVASGFSPVGEEKMRILWAISGPYGSNIWDYLAERGVSVPYWHYGLAARIYYRPYHGDETEFGRKLTPLEEEARALLYNSWAGDGERWIKDTIFACKEFQVDGLVLFEQTGCMPILGLGQLVADRAERELGIPTWCVEGRQLLGRSERTEADFMAGLEAFVNLCFKRKQEAGR